MECEIIGFEKQIMEVEVEGEDKKPKLIPQPIAIITLRSEIPDNLPIGKIVELTVKKEEEKKE